MKIMKEKKILKTNKKYISKNKDRTFGKNNLIKDKIEKRQNKND